MSKIIGITGPQGCGKSTTMNLIGEVFPNDQIYIDDFKVSRWVQQDMGFETLAEATSTYSRMLEFQHNVLHKKIESLSQFKHLTSTFVLTERTFADIYAYTDLWISKFIQSGEVSEEQGNTDSFNFMSQCLINQKFLFSGQIIIPFAEHIRFEEDPNRAALHDVDEFYNRVVDFNGELDKFSMFMLNSKSPEERATDIVADYLPDLISGSDQTDFIRACAIAALDAGWLSVE